MKINRTYSLDLELIKALEGHGNISQLINDLGWEYINKLESNKAPEKKMGDLAKQKADIDEQISEATRGKEIEAKMKKAGITLKHTKFLKSMNTNIMVAKDMKEAWLKLTGKEIGWNKLKILKKEWSV